MLKQKARAIALGVLAGDLALTALSLPVAYMIRHGVLTSISPALFPTPLHPFDRYLFLLVLILPFWTVMLSVAGFYRSHRTLPLAEEIWGATKVAFGGTAWPSSPSRISRSCTAWRRSRRGSASRSPRRWIF